MISSYEDIEAYKKSYGLAIEMYGMTRTYPRDELYGLISQIKRASTSIPLNIAEGYGKRENVSEFKRFLLMAIGSCDEMRVLLSLSKDLGFVKEEDYRRYNEAYKEVGRMLNALRRNWR